MKTNESQTDRPSDRPLVTGTRDEEDGWYLLFEEQDTLECTAYVRARLWDAIPLDDAQ